LFRNPFFRERYNYASYGILYDERYDKQKHLKQKPVRNACDGKQYAIHQIHWLILKSNPIADNVPTRHKCSRQFDLEDPNKRWIDVIVTSRLDPNRLPKFLAKDDTQVQRVCEVSSNLGPWRAASRRPGDDVVEERGGILSAGKKFLRVNYEFLMFVEPDQGLRFETIVDGVNCTVQQNTLEVQWHFREEDESEDDDDILVEDDGEL
jgi:hypothetical protein